MTGKKRRFDRETMAKIFVEGNDIGYMFSEKQNGGRRTVYRKVKNIKPASRKLIEQIKYWKPKKYWLYLLRKKKKHSILSYEDDTILEGTIRILNRNVKVFSMGKIKGQKRKWNSIIK